MSSELSMLRGLPGGQQVSAFNTSIDVLIRYRLDNAAVSCANEAQRGIARFEAIKEAADKAATAIKTRSWDAMAFSDAGKADQATINGIERMLNHGVGPEDVVAKLVERRDFAGIKYVIDSLWSIGVKDVNYTRHSIEARVLPILSDAQRLALLEVKEVESNMASVQRNHNLAIAYFQAAQRTGFVDGKTSPPQAFTDWGQLDEQGNYSFPNGTSVLKLSNGYEQFQGSLVMTPGAGNGVFQNAKMMPHGVR